MGSGTSRGKKVAPACVGQVTSMKPPSRPIKRPLQPPKVRHLLRTDCAQRERRDSGSSGEDGDGEGAPERRGWVSPAETPARKSTRTYGLCHSRRGGEEDSGPEEPPAPRGANKRRNKAFPKHQLKVGSSETGRKGTSLHLSGIGPNLNPTSFSLSLSPCYYVSPPLGAF